MSAGESIPGGEPFNADPVLLLLDRELEVAALDITKTDVARDRLEAAPVLAELGEIAPDTTIAVDIEDRGVGVVTLYFRKSPAPGVDVSDWLWLRDGQPPRHVEIAGAHIPGSLLGDLGRIRQDYPMTFYEVQRFRSGQDLSPEAPASSYPPPEKLDVHTFMYLMQQGYLVKGQGDRWCWRLPGETYNTTRVFAVRQLTADDAAEN